MSYTPSLSGSPVLGTEHSPEQLQGWIATRLAEYLVTEPSQIDPARSLADYGLGSRDALVLLGEIEEFLGQTLSPTIFWEYPSLAALARHLAGKEPEPVLELHSATPGTPSGGTSPAAPLIAVVGL